jgi:methyltransferase (TIGR00027 family)
MGVSGVIMRLVAFVLFVVLQIAFLPLTLVGLVLVTYKQMVVSKRLGVSQTGVEVIHGRWTMHVFDIRKDPAAARLAGAMPNASTFGLWLFLFPLWVKYKLSGTYFAYPRVPELGTEGIADLVIARTLYFDRIIERVVVDAEQFVLLGAGYDTRAYGALRDEGLAFFELDMPATQGHKIAGLQRAGIATDHVTFVPVDLSKESAFEKLLARGYDPRKTTLFLWEGVTLYLKEDDVRKTLREIRAHAAPGSVVVADIYAQRMIRMGSGAIGKTLEYTGEAMSFGLPFAHDHDDVLQRFLESEGIAQGETYFMGTTSAKGPFAVVAELIV